MSKAPRVDRAPIPVVPPASPTMITLAKAAELTGLTSETIRSYITNGLLAGYRLGPRAIRVDLAEVEALTVGRQIPTWTQPR